MSRAPATVEQLREELLRAGGRSERSATFDLKAMNRVLEYTPEDMTVTVEAGISLAQLQARLAERGQWLPIDPPHPETSSIADVLNDNASGPRRFGYGTIREHLLGLKVMLADGRIVQSGGKVVKNVAGYDLCKLFVGSKGSLGVIVQATFKVRPLPEAEEFVGNRCDSLTTAATLLEAINSSELTPVLLELHSLGPGARTEDGGRQGAIAVTGGFCWVVTGFAGTREEVGWQLAQAAGLGLSTATNLDHEKIFWSQREAAPIHRISVLPSRLIQTLEKLGAEQFVARAGNGVAYYQGAKAPPNPELPRTLMRRIKDAYDPKRAFPEIGLFGSEP